MAEKRRAYPLNAPGPFYVLDGCCTSCEIPTLVAPELFAEDGGHCYVKRQPVAAHEVDQLLLAARSADLPCIRYRGTDPEILRRLTEGGEPKLCDVGPPAGVLPLIRDLATFNSRPSAEAPWSAFDLAERFRAWLLDTDRPGGVRPPPALCRPTSVVGEPASASLQFTEWNDRFHTVEFRLVAHPSHRWRMRHGSAEEQGGRAVSDFLHEWLLAAALFRDVRWYSAEEWGSGGAGRESPHG